MAVTTKKKDNRVTMSAAELKIILDHLQGNLVSELTQGHFEAALVQLYLKLCRAYGRINKGHD